MEELITFYNAETDEEIKFEVIDALDLEGQRYLLVADTDNDAAILKEKELGNEEIIYDLVEEDSEFQKLTLMFMENSSDYKLEF